MALTFADPGTWHPDVAAALAQDRGAPQGRAIPALGAANEWLSVLHRLTDSRRVRGSVAILELLLQLLALEPATYVEVAAGGPQAGDEYWDHVTSQGNGKGDDGAGGMEAGKGGVGVGAGGGGRDEGRLETGERFPIMVDSATMFMREHRLWRAARVRHVHPKPQATLSVVLRKRCKGAAGAMDMCRDTVTPHNIKTLLLARAFPPGKSTSILASHTGASDFYLLRAALEAGFLPYVPLSLFNSLTTPARKLLHVSPPTLPHAHPSALGMPAPLLFCAHYLSRTHARAHTHTHTHTHTRSRAAARC